MGAVYKSIARLHGPPQRVEFVVVMENKCLSQGHNIASSGIEPRVANFGH